MWMKGDEVEEDERDFQIKTSEVLPKVSSRPWVGGGAIDYCPCYGQIAFYSLITFSYPHNRVSTHKPQIRYHTNTQLNPSVIVAGTVKLKKWSISIWFPGSVKSISRRLGAAYFQHISIFFHGNMYNCTSSLTRNLFQASEKVRQCYCCLEKVAQGHEAQLDIASRYTGCFLIPPLPLKISK